MHHSRGSALNVSVRTYCNQFAPKSQSVELASPAQSILWSPLYIFYPLCSSLYRSFNVKCRSLLSLSLAKMGTSPPPTPAARPSPASRLENANAPPPRRRLRRGSPTRSPRSLARPIHFPHLQPQATLISQSRTRCP